MRQATNQQHSRKHRCTCTAAAQPWSSTPLPHAVDVAELARSWLRTGEIHTTLDTTNIFELLSHSVGTGWCPDVTVTRGTAQHCSAPYIYSPLPALVSTPPHTHINPAQEAAHASWSKSGTLPGWPVANHVVALQAGSQVRVGPSQKKPAEMLMAHSSGSDTVPLRLADRLH
jgi:hypothetical protein